MPALIEIGHEWVAGGAEESVLAEAIALVDEATEGGDTFSGELGLGDLAEDAPAPPPRHRERRKSRFHRKVPKEAMP